CALSIPYYYAMDYW
nr:immunoglobulin heavy chain junction region [Mus musculus]